MANTLQANFVEQEKMTARSRFLDQLTGFVFVDMGTITNVAMTKKGYRCSVSTYRLTSGQQVIYDGVEVLFPGNLAGGVSFDIDGSPCLVFGPYSSATSIIEGKLLGPNNPYSIKYLKCIPVGDPSYWRGILNFDIQGNMEFKTPASIFKYLTDGTFIFEQTEIQQRVMINSDGDITQEGEGYKRVQRTDGAYYKYVKGVEPGSFSFFESFLDNIKDIFITTIDNFEEEDGEDSEWNQLLDHNSWRYHCNIKEGITEIRYYDEDGNEVSNELIQVDGSRMLINTDADGVTLFSRIINSDGSLDINIGDGKYELNIDKEGHVTETQEGNKNITASGDGSFVVDGKLDLQSTGSSLVTLGNSVDTLGSLLGALCDALSKLHTEGSPAAHKADAWAASEIMPLKSKISQVLG